MTYENIFDTHAHYDDDSFDEDRFSLLDEMFENGVSGIINCGCTVESSKKSIEFTEKYSKIYAAVGIHPQNAAEEKADFQEMYSCRHSKCNLLYNRLHRFRRM